MQVDRDEDYIVTINTNKWESYWKEQGEIERKLDEITEESKYIYRELTKRNGESQEGNVKKELKQIEISKMEAEIL